MSSSTITLSNGIKMPCIGFGTWKGDSDEIIACVKIAIKSGYRMIDTASIYQNEEEIGIAIEQSIQEGIVTRDELFITTKAWITEIGPGKLEAALRASLKKLKLDYVDLYLSHMPTAFEDAMVPIHCPVEEIWSQFDAVYKAGLTKAVGVSNWNITQITRALVLGLTPVHNSQVELHLYFPQHEHVDFCHKNLISVTSYGTTGKATCFDIPADHWAEVPSEFKDFKVLAIAKKYNKLPSQLLYRYVLDRGIAINPRSIGETAIIQNFNVFDFQLSTEEIAQLEEKKISNRLFRHTFMTGHSEDAFVKERK